MKRTALIAILLVTFVSCQNTDESAATNPMPVLWAVARNEIEQLESTTQKRPVWAATAESDETILSPSKLSSILTDLRLSDSEKRQAFAAFDKAEAVCHYGFECNYHALVYFDLSDKPFHVLNW
jgi:hypothetical protein